MPQDFAKRQRGPRKSGYQTNVPAWVWLFTGSVLGAFVMFLIYLTGIPPQPSSLAPKLEDTVSEIAAAEEPSAGDETQEKGIPKPRFDFYRLLRDSEVVVETEATAPPDAKKIEENIEYVLQVGSFKNRDDADRLRAELILLNLNAGIETVQLRNNETWHRVVVGPFHSKPAVSKARNTLYANNLENILFKRNTSG